MSTLRASDGPRRLFYLYKCQINLCARMARSPHPPTALSILDQPLTMCSNKRLENNLLTSRSPYRQSLSHTDVFPLHDLPPPGNSGRKVYRELPPNPCVDKK